VEIQSLEPDVLMTVPSDSSPPKVPTGPRSTPRLAAVARADDLRSRIAARDERALAELVELTSPWLLGVAHGMLQEPDEAEEVVLETFRAAWEKVPKPDDGDRGLIAWLLQVARHKAIDRLRARKRRLRLRDRVATLEPRVTPPVEPDEAAHPGWHIHASVHQALALLPDEQRQAVRLAYFEGHTHSEIAARLDVPLGTVKTRLRLGLGRLRSALAPLKDWVS
jgi:RNA polymerase sigma-70 factor (ECF subfamily)